MHNQLTTSLGKRILIAVANSLSNISTTIFRCVNTDQMQSHIQDSFFLLQHSSPAIHSNSITYLCSCLCELQRKTG